jgi:S-adenosylmethionine hydrolase
VVSALSCGGLFPRISSFGRRRRPSFPSPQSLIPSLVHVVSPLLTLTTDFGDCDTYVAQVKGVILSLVPEVQLVDVTHQIPPGDIRAAALALASILPHYPAGTVHLVVVDPGVGTSRRALAVRTPTARAVGPDNGVLTPILEQPDAVVHEIRGGCFWRENPAPTFHGRDLFAPACAHILAGEAMGGLGEPITDPILVPPSPLSEHLEGVDGVVVSADRFGNLITNIPDVFLVHHTEERMLCVRVAGRDINGLVRTYGDAHGREPIAVLGSGGFLEIAVSGGSAQELLGAEVGTPVEVRWLLR